VPAVSENKKSPTFAPLVAYSTGLLIGRFLVDIVAHRIAAHPRKGNRMSTAKADVLELLEEAPEDGFPGEFERFLRTRTTLASDYPQPARTLSPAEAELWEVLREIAAPTAKHEVLAALHALPDDCTMDDILEELYEREELRRSLASAIYEPRISHDEIKAWIEQCARE
jgi:hypothetical protein